MTVSLERLKIEAQELFHSIRNLKICQFRSLFYDLLMIFVQSQLFQSQRTFDVNVLSHYRMIRTSLPAMLSANRGHVVCIASIFGVDSIAGVSDYGPSKHAAVGLMRSLRQELRLLGKRGVHCTTVMPYQIDTALFSGAAIRFKWLPFMNVLRKI